MGKWAGLHMIVPTAISPPLLHIWAKGCGFPIGPAPSSWPRPHLQAEVEHRSEVKGHSFGVSGHEFIQHLQSGSAQLLKGPKKG